MSDSYVTSQATIRCSCGDKCAKLTIYPDRTVFLTNKPMANISDHVSMYNIAPFGKCHTVAYPPTGSATAANHGHLTPMPCVPGTVSEWINGKGDYIVKGKPALLKSSYCCCKWGGVITITNNGQVDTGNPDLEKQQIETEEEWNEKEQEELLKDKEALLDGIQTALDIAGFVPGVGAIPDLLNAAIYAVRGDKLNAGLSLLAAVPGIGDAAAAAKIAGKGVKAVKTANKTNKIVRTNTSVLKEAQTATTSNVKFGELTQKSRPSSKVEQKASQTVTSSNAKFGELTQKGRPLSKVVQETPQTTTSSNAKFGELTQKDRSVSNNSRKTISSKAEKNDVDLKKSSHIEKKDIQPSRIEERSQTKSKTDKAVDYLNKKKAIDTYSNIPRNKEIQ